MEQKKLRMESDIRDLVALDGRQLRNRGGLLTTGIARFRPAQCLESAGGRNTQRGATTKGVSSPRGHNQDLEFLTRGERG